MKALLSSKHLFKITVVAPSTPTKYGLSCELGHNWLALDPSVRSTLAQLCQRERERERDYDRFKVILDQSSGSEYMAFNCTDVFCEHALLTSCFSYPTVGKNPDVSTGPLARLFACLLAPLTRLLAHSLPFTHSLRCTHLCARSLT